MKIDAVLFDKDGTLMDFDAFWIPVSIKAIEYVLTKLHREDIPVDEFLASLGVYNGIADADGILCKGTYTQIGELVYIILKRYESKVELNNIVALVEKAFNLLE